MPQLRANIEQGDLTEDRREAAILQASLSNYVATAALAVLVGAAGMFTYVSQNFDPHWIFYVLIAGSAVALVASVFIGGKGTGIVIDQIATRTWTPGKRNGRYGTQATFTLIGLGLLLVATAVGVTAPHQQSTLERRVDRLASEVVSLTTTQEQSGSEQLWLEHLGATSDYRIDRLEAQLQQVAGSASEAAAEAHLARQLAVHRRQCRALEHLVHESGEKVAAGLCTNPSP
ncbi:MAG TPA: hypothetical protein VFJ61_12640 [Solirubrobacterales bacterium]|nr:hypothetical protein [Solirubrobacterales bacterium]